MFLHFFIWTYRPAETEWDSAAFSEVEWEEEEEEGIWFEFNQIPTESNLNSSKVKIILFDFLYLALFNKQGSE